MLTSWLQKKRELGQDVLLAGSDRGELLKMVTRCLGSEFEYVAISKDTCGSDLAQRLELGPGRVPTACDGPAVRAAKGGRALILDGIDRAERNVLPVLHNLLEHRELALDDGTLLSWKTSISDDFWVLALASVVALRVAPFDPPLRSRFVARVVPPFICHDDDESLVSRILAAIQEHHPTTTRPRSILGGRENDDMKSWGVPVVKMARAAEDAIRYGGCGCRAILRAYPPGLWSDGARRLIQGWTKDEGRRCPPPKPKRRRRHGGLLVPSRESVVDAVLEDIASSDAHPVICGPRGSGKSAVARVIVEALGVSSAAAMVVACHGDLCARDLVARRALDLKTGATRWRLAPLARAVRDGTVVILDGCHRLGTGVLAAAVGSLFSSSFLATPETMIKPKPGFRVILLGDGVDWINSDIGSLAKLRFFMLPPLTTHEVKLLLEGDDVLLRAIDRLSRSDPRLRDLVASPRSLVRVASNFTANGGDLVAALERTFALLPHKECRAAFDHVVADLLVGREKNQVALKPEEKLRKDWTLEKRDSSTNPEFIPTLRRRFVATKFHGELAASVASDLLRGNAVLVVGDQGVGKNMIIDYVLAELQWEREYIQLHRDSTAASLTTSPGRLADPTADPPLVRAARCGRVLVVDEADKASVSAEIKFEVLSSAT